MTKDDFDFDAWFECLADMVLDSTRIAFCDRDSVRDAYEAGRNLADVANEIIAEYNE